MSEGESKFHRDTIEKVQAQKAKCAQERDEMEGHLRDIENTYRELDAIERYHVNALKGLGAANHPLPTFAPIVANAIMRRKRHEACLEVLKEARRPLKTVEISEVLRGIGDGPEMDASVHQTAIYTALKRHPETFILRGPGEWGLKEWDESDAGR